MKNKLTILAIIIGAAGCFTSVGMAADFGEFHSPDDEALILKEFDRLHIEAPVAANLAVMNVRVFGPDNTLLLSERTMGESVEFLVSGDLPDGEYRYETVSIFGNVDLSDRSKYVEGEKILLRKFGSFNVSNGQIIEKTVPNQLDLGNPDDASLMDRMLKRAVNLAGITLDFLIPSAHAQDLRAESSTPHITFDDTNDEDCTPGYDWAVKADGGTSDADTNNTYVITGVGEAAGPCFADVPIITLHHNGLDGASSSADALVVDSDGDIHWAQGRLNFDKGSSSLGIGTSSTGAELVISALSPEIRLFEESFADYMYTNYDGNWYNIGYWSAPGVRINWDSPGDAFLLDGFGNVGIGTSTASLPTASLEVRRSDGSAKILVNETGASATRTLFELQNAGRTHFKITNTDAGSQWVFTNTGSSFFISLQGTGGPEFKILNNGNAILAGVLTEGSDINTKTAITDIDEQEILNLVSALPVTKWEYKDARGEVHIGPMAQDFYAAFGLGNSETGIATIDTVGVALAAIKALNEANISLKQQNSELFARIEKLEHQQSQVQAMMAAIIETQKGALVLTKTAMN